MIKKLVSMPYAQAKVEILNCDTVILVSYTTQVVIIKDGWLTCYGLYSMTTRKHISAFLKEYAPMISFNTAKLSYLQNFSINIHTGEIIDR